MSDKMLILRDGKPVATNDLADLRLRLARQEMLRQIDNSIALGEYVWGYNYSGTDGINSGASSNYLHIPASNLVTNRNSSENTFAQTIAGTNYANRCSINRFSGLSASGNLVRVKFKADGGTRDIDAAYIGTHPGSGNAWDADTDNTQLLFSGSGTASLADGEELWSDWVAFTLVHTNDIVVAVDEGASGFVGYDNGFIDVDFYHKTSTDDAANQSRSAGYTTNSGRCRGITAIEVLSAAQVMSLISPAYSAGVEPNTLQIFAEYNSPDEDIVIETDLEYNVSIDGGTTYAETDFSGGVAYVSGVKNLVSGEVDVSAQTGTSWVMKIDTPATAKLAEIIWWVGVQTS